MTDYLRREADRVTQANKNCDGAPLFFLNNDAFGYEFTNQWFEQNNQAVFEAVLVPFFREVVKDPVRYLEIGVNEGASMVWAIHRLNLEFAVGVDPYSFTSGPRMRERNVAIREAEARMVINIARAVENMDHPDGLVRIIRFLSKFYLVDHVHEKFARRVEKPTTFNLIYIDGDHSGLGTLRDLVLAFEVLEVGGVLVVDDLNRRWAKGRPQTKEAFEGWYAACENHLEPIYRDKRIAMVQKIKD